MNSLKRIIAKQKRKQTATTAIQATSEDAITLRINTGKP